MLMGLYSGEYSISFILVSLTFVSVKKSPSQSKQLNLVIAWLLQNLIS